MSMNFEWMASPLALYAAFTAGLICSFVLFITLKVEIAAVNRKGELREQTQADRLQQVKESLELLREQAADHSSATVNGLNLTRRTQALRMHKRGEPVETIAAALKAPRGEIELLLKLQEILDCSVGS